mmetsp:Transcript_12327/g.38009  ORF Transcript_12327/g.38009 Transcript_12327/m.38009 type:complete len:246 (-) Transcript_12327:293-1030(-)
MGAASARQNRVSASVGSPAGQFGKAATRQDAFRGVKSGGAQRQASAAAPPHKSSSESASTRPLMSTASAASATQSDVTGAAPGAVSTKAPSAHARTLSPAPTTPSILSVAARSAAASYSYEQDDVVDPLRPIATAPPGAGVTSAGAPSQVHAPEVWRGTPHRSKLAAAQPSRISRTSALAPPQSAASTAASSSKLFPLSDAIAAPEVRENVAGAAGRGGSHANVCDVRDFSPARSRKVPWRPVIA